ncbi:MAG: YfcE family phosphodiesterase [Bacteroidetes bacterium GWF2_49_14]|nr:MAG: YfcE family phosphodiesterase [Bacteroidetes bacterium GWF2_49_14]HBB92146.1 YfcE family phosphodiesterase [Bacteroidales bacterium]
MIRIGVLSDTHGHMDEPVLDFFKDCNEIWHAGDLGDIEIMDLLSQNRTYRGVYGNIDGWEVRRELPEFLEFTIENVKVLITHIGLYAGHYKNEVVDRLNSFKPNIFVCGHSHILKVKYDQSRKMLHINPGSAGVQGIHQVRTAVRFEIDGEKIENMDVLELPKRR